LGTVPNFHAFDALAFALCEELASFVNGGVSVVALNKPFSETLPFASRRSKR
jgi:hypothetical protein